MHNTSAPAGLAEGPPNCAVLPPCSCCHVKDIPKHRGVRRVAVPRLAGCRGLRLLCLRNAVASCLGTPLEAITLYRHGGEGSSSVADHCLMASKTEEENRGLSKGPYSGRTSAAAVINSGMRAWSAGRGGPTSSSTEYMGMTAQHLHQLTKHGR